MEFILFIKALVYLFLENLQQCFEIKKTTTMALEVTEYLRFTVSFELSNLNIDLNF